MKYLKKKNEYFYLIYYYFIMNLYENDHIILLLCFFIVLTYPFYFIKQTYSINDIDTSIVDETKNNLEFNWKMKYFAVKK